MSQQPPRLRHLPLPDRVEQRRPHGLEAPRLVPRIDVAALAEQVFQHGDPLRVFLARSRHVQGLAVFDPRAVVEEEVEGVGRGDGRGAVEGGAGAGDRL